MSLHHAVTQWFIQRHSRRGSFRTRWLTTTSATSTTGSHLRLEVRLLLLHLGSTVLLQCIAAVRFQDRFRVDAHRRQLLRHWPQLGLQGRILERGLLTLLLLSLGLGLLQTVRLRRLGLLDLRLAVLLQLLRMLLLPD